VLKSSSIALPRLFCNVLSAWPGVIFIKLNLFSNSIKLVLLAGAASGRLFNLAPVIAEISNPGFASLDRVFRPNKNIGEIVAPDGSLNMEDSGIFKGSKASLSGLKQAALLDSKYATIKQLYDEYKASIAGSVESKAKAFGKDLDSTETLSKLEGAMDMPVESPLRLSNAMKNYYDKNNELINTHQKNSFLLGRKLDIKKNEINNEIASRKFQKTEERINKVSEQKKQNIKTYQDIIDKKSQQIKQHQEFKTKYDKVIEKAKFDRAAALNEIKAVGRADTPLGRIQRTFLAGAGWGTISGHPGIAIPPALAATVLSPKAGIPIIRGILKSSRKGMLNKINRGTKAISNNKLLRQLIIGSSLQRNN